MRTRRQITQLLIASAASAWPLTQALAIPDLTSASPIAPLPVGPDGSVLTMDEALAKEVATTGAGTPYKSEVEMAKKVLARAPSSASGRRVTPLEVAQYFLDVGAGRFEAEWMGYVEEWPVRANPVIVAFFEKTSYRKPAGDTTPWCAAFVNWCIHRASEGRAAGDMPNGTNSAASQSFLRWEGGERTDNPQPGDLCVFTNTDDAAHGHVGFYLGRSGSTIFILGGNQRYQNGRNNGEVNVSRFNSKSASQPLTAFITARGLRA